VLYDCFLFSDELELLEVRLHELAGVVDTFVLVEATTTFSGLPKPLYFAEAAARFDAFRDRIVHVVVDDLPVGDAWTRERHQRNAVLRGLAHARPDDRVLLSDVDEIPRATAVLQALGRTGILSLEQRFYYYWLNCRLSAQWPDPRLATYEDIRRLSPAALRRTPGEVVHDAGWHFSYMGGAGRIQRKLRSFSHQEFNCWPYVDEAYIEEARERGDDLFARPDVHFELVPIDDSYPRFILEHQAQFAGWIKPVSASVSRVQG
jgi:beta-1,4-mannosyl-glycoprotein beta-1,4-N-acetylglucosaminyltransferase